MARLMGMFRASVIASMTVKQPASMIQGVGEVCY
jgi:hypothetical protein